MSMQYESKYHKVSHSASYIDKDTGESDVDYSIDRGVGYSMLPPTTTKQENCGCIDGNPCGSNIAGDLTLSVVVVLVLLPTCCYMVCDQLIVFF